MKAAKLNKQQEQEIVNKYNNNGCVNHLAIEYTTTTYHINKILKDNNIKTRGSGVGTSFTPRQDQEMIRLYNDNYTFKEISVKFNCCENAIAYRLKKYGVHGKPQTLAQRKYNINENFFSNPVEWNYSQFYWFGWLLSDGYLNTTKNSLSIGLQEKDKDILLKLKKIINYNGPLAFVDRTGETFSMHKHKKYYMQNQYRLTITNKKITNDLKNIMDFSNKSHCLLFPSIITDKYLKAFLQGFWEGDGTLKFKNKPSCPNVCISIISTKEMCVSLKEKLQKLLNIYCYLYSPPIYKHGTSTISIGEQLGVLKFLNFIYEDSIVRLDRKFKKFQKLIKILNKKQNITSEVKKELEKSNQIISKIIDL